MTQAVTLSGLGSTNALYTDSSGNVGIGTSSPNVLTNQTRLTINGTSASGLSLYVNGISTANAVTSSGAYFLGSVTNIPLIFSTTDIERMRIDSSGNVGIGTSSPGYLLNVSKNGGGGDSAQLVRFTDTSTSNSIGPLHLTMGAANHYAQSPSPVLCGTNGIALGVGDGSDLANQRKLTIDSSGNVGIGTSSPVCKLTVYSSTAQNDAYGFVQIENPTAAAAVNASYTAKNYSGTSQFMQWEHYGLRIGSRIVANTGLGNITFTTGNDVERMRIDASGRVTMPYQPSFSAYGSGSNVVATAGSSSFAVMDSVMHNIGSHFSTSTYRFTAPVAGRYLFKSRLVVAVNAQTVGGSADMMWGFYVNSSPYGSTYGGGFVGYYGESTRVDIINLAVGDYVTVGIRPSNSVNLTMVYNMSNFSGELLA